MTTPRPSLSFVVAVLALLVATGSTSYAAGLARNSVGTEQLKPNAVTAAKIKDGSLSGAEVRDGTVGVVQAVRERVLRREERDHATAGHVVAEVGHQVPEVVLFLRTDGAVGEEHVRAVTRQAADRVVGVDPRVHAGSRTEGGARRPQFDGDHGSVARQGFGKGRHGDERGRLRALSW